MNANTINLQEEKNRKKGFYISVGLHILLLLLALFPLLSNMQLEEPEQAEFVTIDFTDFRPASREGARPQAAKATAKKKQAKKSVPKATPVPKPKPAPESKPKKVLTSSAPEVPIKTSPETKPTVEEAPLEKPVPEDVDPKAPTETEEAAEETDAKEATGSSAKSDEKTSAESGEGKSDKSDGKADAGINWGEVTGDGLFSRRVIYRADVRKITEEEGKIVVRLCVDRGGKVVFAQNDDATTIEDNAIIRKAIQLTTRYRFEKDYTAPAKQCGKLTYIFEIEKE